MATNNRNEVTGWVGWVYFAGLLMVVTGILHVIAGLAALLRETYFLVQDAGLVVFDFATWGWIHLLMGVVVMMAGTAVVSGQVWGRVVGVFLAIAAMIANFAFMSAYPLWSIVSIVVDVLVIYALTVHGNEAA